MTSCSSGERRTFASSEIKTNLDVGKNNLHSRQRVRRAMQNDVGEVQTTKTRVNENDTRKYDGRRNDDNDEENMRTIAPPSPPTLLLNHRRRHRLDRRRRRRYRLVYEPQPVAPERCLRRLVRLERVRRQHRGGVRRRKGIRCRQCRVERLHLPPKRLRRAERLRTLPRFEVPLLVIGAPLNSPRR